MNRIFLKRGLKDNLPILNEGEPAFTTDTNELYIGSSTGNKHFPNQLDYNNLMENYNSHDKFLKHIWIDVGDKKYGAKGDGTTDDTIAIQSAINDTVLYGGGAIYFPKGTYKITSSLNFKSDNITFNAPAGTTIMPYNCDCIVFGDNTNDIRYNFVNINGLHIDMEHALTYIGIRAICTDELHFSDVLITKGRWGIQLDYSFNVTLEDVICIAQSDTGLVATLSDKMLILRGQYGNGEIGIQILGGKAITLIGTSIERNNNVGLLLGSSNRRGSWEYCDSVNIHGCYMERNAMLRGNGFIVIGDYNNLTNEYTQSINLIGNYFNWDVANPRTPIVPILYFDRCTYVNCISNKYMNTTNYSDKSIQAYDNTITGINDKSTVARESVLSKKNQFILPFNIVITTNANGYGEYTYDTTDFLFTEKFVVGNVADIPNANAYHTIIYPNQNQFKVILNSFTPNTQFTFTGLLMGTQNL